MKRRGPSTKRELRTPRADSVDVILSGGTILNVYSGELLRMNVVIRGDRISYVGPLTSSTEDNTNILDVAGKVLVPGYIDPHFHPWNIYNPISISKAACLRGTTSLFCDNLIFYMLMGVDRFEEFMEILLSLPVRLFWFCRSVPQTPMVEEDALFSVENLTRLLKNPAVQSLGEITRWPDLVRGNRKIQEMIKGAKGFKKRIDGHTAGAGLKELNELAFAGVESCHESIRPEEVLNRLRLGYYVMLRESSLRQDLRNLLKVIEKGDLLTDRLMLTTDGSSPSYYQEHGITDHVLEIAIEEGIDPVLAYRMATINPAVYYGLDSEIGGIAPGRYADILVLKDLLHPVPELVMCKGRILAEEGVLIEGFPTVDWGKFFPQSIFPKREGYLGSETFRIPFKGTHITFPTIKLVNTVITRWESIEFEIQDGFLDLASKNGFCFVATLNKGGKWVSNGVLQGFGDGVEGLASSFNTATEVLVIGRDPEAMCVAANRVLEMKGGIVGVEKGQVIYEFALPLGGVMSDEPLEKIAEKERELKDFLSARGYPFHDPLFTLMFLPNDFLPEVRINYKGVVDIKNNVTLWPRRDLVLLGTK